MESKERHLKEHQILAAQRYNDRKTQMPLANMSFKDTIPFISIMGPPNTGKARLFQSLVNRLTKKEIVPDNMITISTTKTKLTLFKSESSLESYIDCAKISDLVILAINGESFEIDTFEIIGLMKAHGMSKILVSVMNSNRKSFKDIKKRLWSEITDGIKIFDIDVSSNLDKMVRYIKDMKYRPLQWRCNNSYVIPDRINWKKVENGYSYSFYGYIRGCPLKENIVYIPDKGTFNILSKEILHDPCFVSEGKVLDREKRIFYAPKFYSEEIMEVKEDVSSDEDVESDKFMIYNMKEGVNIVKGDDTKNQKENIQELNKPDIINEIETEEKSKDLDTLLESVKSRFKKKAQTEEDFIEKFNEEYKEDEKMTTEREERLTQEAKNLLNNRKYIPGEYIRIDITADKKLDFNSLTIIGSIKITNQVTIQGRVKKTNHFPYILKSNQRYMVSVGWKREVTDVVFSYKDPTRNRFLKYLLANSYCNANFFSEIVLPGTPFCIIQAKKFEKQSTDEAKPSKSYKKENIKERSISKETDKKDENKEYVYNETEKFFRIAAMGTILDVSGKTGLVKKLKLIGYPKRIMENTVFVRDMFTSDKEVAKFEGALLKTVGGLRGSIKKGVGSDGTFRATFEGRILMSDIVFMRCYVPYEVHENDKNHFTSNKVEVKRDQKNLTIVVEDKKRRKVDCVIKNLKQRLTLDKQEIIDENKPFTLPVSPLDEEFVDLKSQIEQKRLKIDTEAQNKKLLNEIKAKKEQLILDKEKKQRLRKNILESKFESKITKKKHKPKRK